MKLALAIASFFGLTLTLVRGGAIYRRAIPDLSGGCQTNPTLLDNTTVTFENFTIGYTSVTCPLVSCPASKRATIEQRDPICAAGATCTVNCTSLSDTSINLADCQPIIQYLGSLGTTNFTIPAQTFDFYYLNTCTVGFWNYDCANYTACFSDFGTNIANVGTTCGAVSNGGYCAGADTPGEEWVVGIL